MTIFQLIFGFGFDAGNLAVAIANAICAAWALAGVGLPWLLAYVLAQLTLE